MTYASWNINEFKIVLVENGFKSMSNNLESKCFIKHIGVIDSGQMWDGL